MTDPLPIHQANFHVQLPIGRGLLCGSSIHYQSVPIWANLGPDRNGSDSWISNAKPICYCINNFMPITNPPIRCQSNQSQNQQSNVNCGQRYNSSPRPIQSEIQDLPFTDCLKYTEGQPKEEDDQR